MKKKHLLTFSWFSQTIAVKRDKNEKTYYCKFQNHWKNKLFKLRNRENETLNRM